MEALTLRLSGIPGVALMTHNERLANPLDPITREMKAVSSKRSKTDEDLAELARLEFEGGLYLTEDGQAGIPSWNIFRSIQDGGKVNRLGTAIARAVVMTSADIVPIKHSGPSSPEAMFAAGMYDQRSVKVGQAKVTRTRPIFRDWVVEASLLLDTEIVNLDDFLRAAENAGRMSGIGEYRPRFGRYEVESV